MEGIFKRGISYKKEYAKGMGGDIEGNMQRMIESIGMTVNSARVREIYIIIIFISKASN